MTRVIAALERRSTVYAASIASLLLGLFFIFVWTPLPWGWKGIDDYGRIAQSLARGEPFPTVHLVWGYAYFLSVFYGLFGDHPAIPLTAQALLNACIPVLLYYMVRLEMGERIAVMAAVLAGLFSFNTVYTSTQASDSVCTVLVVATMLCLTRGDHQQRTSYFAASGLLAALAYQFRPNLLLFPGFIAVLYVLFRARASRRFVHAGVMLGVFLIGAAPWVIRNYRWTGLFIPASTHGGVQLWFGTLQTREYRASWLYNPRAAFEFPPVDYTSLDELPVVVTGVAPPCSPGLRQGIELVYWSSRDRTPRRLPVSLDSSGAFTVNLPAQRSPTALYYYFDAAATAESQTMHVLTPADGSADPFMVVVSRDHFGDLDVDGQRLDLFDIAAMLRLVAWQEPLTGASRLDFDGDGRVTEADVHRASALVVDERGDPSQVADPVAGINSTPDAVTLRFKDGSSVAVPKTWSGQVTDLRLETPIVASSAAMLVSHSRSFASVTPRPNPPQPRPDSCLTVGDVAANRVPYRRLPHEMRRFTALALDNIRKDPIGYAQASAIRALRVFIIVGSEDQRTAYQFAGAGTVYAIGRVASIAYLVLLVAGVVIARVRGLRLFMLLAPILYVPITICFMLINARYSMTMQPFVFALVAVPLVTALEAWSGSDRRTAALSR